MKPDRPIVILDLFQFLHDHRSVNRRIQQAFIREALSPANLQDRAVLLMHKALNTQSKPQLDAILEFRSSLKPAALKSFRGFTAFLQDHEQGVFGALASQPGWGNKTAALFLRNLAIIEVTPSLKLWRDIDLLTGDQLWLPVDAVILAIFRKLQRRLPEWKLDNFRNINAFLRNDMAYTAREMMVWDDLWFWGFITQRSTPGSVVRSHAWNEAKYWAIPHAPTDAASLRRTRVLGQEFLRRL
jgi:hypothetical protein